MKCFVSTFDGNSTLHCRSDSLLSRCKARSRGNVECRMEELECAGYQLPALGQRCEQREMGWWKLLIVTPRGCRDRETKEESWDTGR